MKKFVNKKKYINFNRRTKAITLAETLISLMILGLVSVLVIVPLFQDINRSIINKQNKAFMTKFESGLQTMRLKNKLAYPYDTASFVEEMENHFNIVKVCNSNNLDGCFPKIIKSYEHDNNGKFYNVSECKTANLLNHQYPNSPVYGVIFADKTSMLISYIPECIGASIYGIDGDTKKCLLYLIDVNGNKSPNSYGGASNGINDKKISGNDIIGNLTLDAN